MKNYNVQWAGQYYAAYELSRRGYLASITVGNAPETDILAKSPGGKTFSVEVKAMRTDNYWRIKYPRFPSDYWFFVLIEESPAPMITILTGEEVVKEWENCYEYDCKNNPNNLRHDKYKYPLWGIKQRVIHKYRERDGWEVLPK